MSLENCFQGKNIVIHLASIREKGQGGSNDVHNLGFRNAYTNLDIAQVANSAFGNDKLEYHDEIQESIIDSYMSSEKLKAAVFFCEI